MRTIPSLKGTHSGVQLESSLNKLLGKITMFPWLISPWEVARLSLEAQRAMAFHFLSFAPRQEQRHQEVLSDGGKAPSVDLPMPARSIATGRPKTVHSRKAMEIIKEPISARKMKDKKPRRKNKTRKK